MLQVHLHIHTIIMAMFSVIIRLSVVSEKGLCYRGATFVNVFSRRCFAKVARIFTN